MEKPIRYLVPDLPSAHEILPFLQQIDQNKMYTNFGPLQYQLVESIRRAFFSEEVALVATSSCTSSLHLALLALGLEAGSHVLLPNYTFPATGVAAKSLGHHLILGHVTQNLELTPEIALHYLQQGHPIDVVIPVCPYGVAVDVAQWADFHQRTGIPVVIDAAAALGNVQPVAGVVCCYSMHATKPFGIGEGGLIASLDPKFIHQCTVLANFGFNGTRSSEFLGINAKLSEYHAAVGLAQMQRWPALLARRCEIHREYLEALQARDLQSLAVFNEIEAHPSNFIIHVDSQIIDSMMHCLTQHQIEVHRGYYPLLSQMPVFKKEKIAAGNDFIENALVGTTLALPFHTSLTRQHIEYIVQNLHACSQ